ncbi:MAG: hypothetical protein ACI8QH_001156, partial [Flammeovirgaceae bacterium]
VSRCPFFVGEIFFDLFRNGHLSGVVIGFGFHT